MPLAQPVRALDTTIPANATKVLDVTTVPGAPPETAAVVLNLTGASPTANTYLTVFPAAAGATVVPTVSNLNLTRGVTRANLVTVPIGAGGAITLYNRVGSVRAVVDVAGYYTNTPGGLAYYPIPPIRLLDTRVGLNTQLQFTDPLGADSTLQLPVAGTTTTSTGIVTVPLAAQAVVANITAVGPTAYTYLTVYAPSAGGDRPLASNLNIPANAVVSNLAMAAIGSGSIEVYNRVGKTAVLADLAGYYA